MKIDLKKILLAGTAIVAFGAVTVPAGQAQAQCVTTGNINANCDFTEPATTGAITIDNGVAVNFNSAGNTISIVNTIDGSAADGDGSLTTAGNGTTVLQEANVGATTAPGALTINAGDVWLISGGNLSLSSAGALNINGGTLSFGSGGSTIGSDTAEAGMAFTGGSAADTVVFASQGVGVGGAFAANTIYASAFNLAGGNDVVNFASGNGMIFASSFTMGAGNDTVTFVSGSLDTTAGAAGVFDLGSGNDTLVFSSTPAGDGDATGIVNVDSFTAGSGNDTVTFENAEATFTTNGGNFDLGTGNDTLTMSSGSIVTGGGNFLAGDGSDTITFASAAAGSVDGAGIRGGRIDLGGGNFDLGSGSDTVTFVSGSGGILNANQIDGGSGTDTINFNSGNGFGDYTISTDIVNVEAINVGDAAVLTLNDSVTGGTITLGSGSALTYDDGDTGETISANITGATGANQVQTITLTAGTISGNINLGDGDDVINYNSGSITGTMAFGTGNDTLAINAPGAEPVNIVAAVSGLETATIAAGDTVNLSAAVTGVDDADDTGFSVGTGTLNINNGGSIDGAIHGAGGGTVNFGADNNGGTFTLGGIIEDLQLVVTSGTVNTNSFDLGGNNALASLTVGDGGGDAIFIASSNVITAGALALNSATLRVNAGNIVTAATYNEAAATDGNFVIEVANSTGGIDVGGITLTGEALDGFTTETFEIVVGPNSLAFTSGDSVVFGSGTAGAAAPGAANVTETSFLYDFTIGAAGNNLVLNIVTSGSLAELTTTSNNQAVAEVLLTDPVINASTDETLTALISNLSNASNSEEFNNVLEQAQPTIDGSNVAAAVNVVNSSMNIMVDRLAALRTGEEVTGMTTGNMTQGLRAWMQGFGATGEQDRRDNIDGYDFDSYGVAVGLDTENIAENTTLGIAFSFADTEADSENASQTNTEIESYQFTLYGEHEFRDNIYLNGMAAYTLNSTETRRQVANAFARGDYDADQFTLRAEVGRDYQYETTTLTPHVLGHWTYYDAEEYTETGAGAAGRRIDSDTLHIFELGVGVDASWLFQNSDGSFFSPELSVGYRYDFADDNVEMTSQFVAGGASITTEGFDPQQHTFNAGAGFTYYSTENWELTAEYDFEFKEDFHSHAGLLRAGYRF